MERRVSVTSTADMISVARNAHGTILLAESQCAEIGDYEVAAMLQRAREKLGDRGILSIRDGIPKPRTSVDSPLKDG